MAATDMSLQKQLPSPVEYQKRLCQMSIGQVPFGGNEAKSRCHRRRRFDCQVFSSACNFVIFSRSFRKQPHHEGCLIGKKIFFNFLRVWTFYTTEFSYPSHQEGQCSQPIPKRCPSTSKCSNANNNNNAVNEEELKLLSHQLFSQ